MIFSTHSISCATTSISASSSSWCTLFLESGYCCIGCPLWQSSGTTLVNIGTLHLFVPTLHSFVTSIFIVYLVWRFCFSFYDVKINVGLVVPSTYFSYSLSQTFPLSFSTHNDFSFDSSFSSFTITCSLLWSTSIVYCSFTHIEDNTAVLFVPFVDLDLCL